MIRTIFVPTSGSLTDGNVFAAACGIARISGAHLDCYHVRVDPAEIAGAVHGDFAMGAAIGDVIRTLDARSDAKLAEARRHFADICVREKIPIVTSAHAGATLSAAFTSDAGGAFENMLAHARHRDLTIVGRPHHADGLPVDFIERLLLESGRPILVVAETAYPSPAETVAVLWKECAPAVRAIAAALPLLKHARKVVLIGAEEGFNSGQTAIRRLAEELAWRGIVTEQQVAIPRGRPIADMLFAAARTQHADLIVAGAFGHSRAREMFLGGVTAAALAQAETPVFLMH